MVRKGEDRGPRRLQEQHRERQDKALQENEDEEEKRRKKHCSMPANACCFASNNLRPALGTKAKEMRVQARETGSAQLIPTGLAR